MVFFVVLINFDGFMRLWGNLEIGTILRLLYHHELIPMPSDITSTYGQRETITNLLFTHLVS